MIADRLALAVGNNKSAFLGMATGSTPKAVGFWAELRQRVARGELDLAGATFCNPDEWIGLDPQHSESYKSYLTRELSDHFTTTVMVPDGAAADPVAAAVEMERKIMEAGGFEWMLLGMGINGHIGFFEPNEALPSHPFKVAIDE